VRGSNKMKGENKNEMEKGKKQRKENGVREHLR
jgi:hypothetical protein